MAAVITSVVDETSGTNQGKVGDVVDINGTGLATTTTVNFGGTTVTPTSVSNILVKFVVPATAPCSGQVQVSVKLSNGTLSNGQSFFVIAAPSTVSSSPATLSPAGGLLTVLGTGFAAGGQVTVGSAGTVAFAAGGSNTSVTVTAPAHTPAGCSDSQQITVTTAGGTGTAGTSFVTYQNPPTLTGTAPTSGTAGDPVTINGSCLDNLLSVTYTDSTGTHTEPDLTASSSGTFILSTVPGGTLVPDPVNPGTITVTTSGGTDTIPFTIT
ncbi:IPT/TIG domain-containing protein [Streptomyces hyaluromycini]|uniref:IPT/TIG domain-containing protein n=1 Tax=Streptomyces hyaluromycini TaxID=1377993 RepID=UPI000B5CA1CF|nr:IPT/TIG domain-containing protein [Streptomyces hyaluromycini]